MAVDMEIADRGKRPNDLSGQSGQSVGGRATGKAAKTGQQPDQMVLDRQELHGLFSNMESKFSGLLSELTAQVTGLSSGLKAQGQELRQVQGRMDVVCSTLGFLQQDYMLKATDPLSSVYRSRHRTICFSGAHAAVVVPSQAGSSSGGSGGDRPGGWLRRKQQLALERSAAQQLVHVIKKCGVDVSFSEIVSCRLQGAPGPKQLMVVEFGNNFVTEMMLAPEFQEQLQRAHGMRLWPNMTWQENRNKHLIRSHPSFKAAVAKAEREGGKPCWRFDLCVIGNWADWSRKDSMIWSVASVAHSAEQVELV